MATHPTDPRTIAVAYQRFGGRGAKCGILAGLRISHDGGRTWTEAPGHPWDRTRRAPSFHSAIAWGPGPKPGSARLYWIDTTVPGCDYSKHQVALSYSDDEGASWSPLQVQVATPAWIGGLPDIAAVRDPRSPDRGVVYAVYNWAGRPGRGPGLRLLASRDFGRSWRAIEIDSAPSPPGYPVAWRIGYHVGPTSDGGAYVSWFQADLRRWDPSDFFDRGSVGNVGRAGFVVVRVRSDGSGRLVAGAPVIATTVARNGYDVSGWTAPGTSSHSYPDPSWTHGLAVDEASGSAYLAIAEYRAAGGGPARGSIRLGTSDDGRTWRWTAMPELPRVAGHPVSPFRPTLAVREGIVFVGCHWISDATVGRGLPAVGEGYAISFDAGATFSVAAAIPMASWRATALASAPNGPGLRDRAAVTADGRFVFVYGDGRRAAAAGSTAGPAAVMVAAVSVRMPRESARRR